MNSMESNTYEFLSILARAGNTEAWLAVRNVVCVVTQISSEDAWSEVVILDGCQFPAGRYTVTHNESGSYLHPVQSNNEAEVDIVKVGNRRQRRNKDKRSEDRYGEECHLLFELAGDHSSGEVQHDRAPRKNRQHRGREPPA